MGRILSVFAAAAISVLLASGDTAAGDRRLEGTGSIGSGIFLPTGSDGDVARTSPVLQLAASVRFAPHIGAEAEFLYVPILFRSDILASAASRKSSQISALGGVRFTTGSFLDRTGIAVGYLSARAGFARLVTKTSTALPQGGWIGRAVDEIENPGSDTGVTERMVERGVVLSPKAGVLLRLSNRAALDLAVQPVFIFDRGDVSTQIFFTLGVAVSSWQNF